ncbi:hypothetical protein SDC9_75228 [bioreactor metagenome]|uniref:Uncharacterized protein n=1 Tax=bioreactor metagenome TaxID=1076179 RepID=A0A644YJZ9_9ZZZZ
MGRILSGAIHEERHGQVTVAVEQLIDRAPGDERFGLCSRTDRRVDELPTLALAGQLPLDHQPLHDRLHRAVGDLLAITYQLRVDRPDVHRGIPPDALHHPQRERAVAAGQAGRMIIGPGSAIIGRHATHCSRRCASG